MPYLPKYYHTTASCLSILFDRISLTKAPKYICLLHQSLMIGIKTLHPVVSILLPHRFQSDHKCVVSSSQSSLAWGTNQKGTEGGLVSTRNDSSRWCYYQRSRMFARRGSYMFQTAPVQISGGNAMVIMVVFWLTKYGVKPMFWISTLLAYQKGFNSSCNIL